MAPEVIRGTDYSEKCDTYSWAIVFWQLLSKKLLPYGDKGIGLFQIFAFIL
jgi:serine/threonine protein kinase